MKNIGETKEAGQAGLRNRPPSPTRSGLLRRTFLIAFVLVSGGLITGGVIELYYRYLETMDTIAMLQGEMARSAAFKIRQFVRDIEKTLRATPQSRENVRGGLSDAYRFQLLKMMKITPAITTMVVIGEDGKEMWKSVV